MNRILATIGVVALSGIATASRAQLQPPIAEGRYEPTMDSLKQYRAPDWFRDAKFGIWAHWGPQSVPMDGDWYARGMYEQGSGHYNYHVANYGHPSVFGYKDIIPLWKAEKWDPDRLMQLYKKAGARYFVSMGTHHDNFFLWKSQLHKWNAVEMGPHRDVVGDWQKAARKYGLKFGVSEHLAASFTWFQGSHGADKTGPKAGVPYDGANPAYQDLYHFPAEPGDTGWNSNNPKWQQQWYQEIRELVDNYHPDLLYSDSGVPFSNEVGRSMIAHYYNQSAAVHSGRPQVVYNCKQASEGRWVEDLERGIMGGIDPNPWQTDTSIGDWFYNRNWKFRPVNWVIHTLVDNVSKNGNLLLNVVQRPDGSLDPEVETMLTELATWNAVHGEAIYGSRPWKVYGEGTVRAKGGSFNEDYTYSSKDIRFTTRGGNLYAVALGWPADGRLLIRSLAKPAGKNGNSIKSVSLLGSKLPVTWKQTEAGLEVTLPVSPVSRYTCGLRIQGSSLQPAPVPVVVPVASADVAGKFQLLADTAELHGTQIRTESRDGNSNIGFWDKGVDYAEWRVRIPSPGKYQVSLNLASFSTDTAIVASLGGSKVTFKSVNTGDWAKYQEVTGGILTVEQAGEFILSIRSANPAEWKPINLKQVNLIPVQ